MNSATFRQRFRQSRRLRTAAAALELAILLPSLLIIAFGCADFGRYIHAYIAVSNAARSGAEYGGCHRVTPYTEAYIRNQIEQVVREEMATVEAYQAEDTVVSIDISSDELPLVRVEVDCTFRTLFAWPVLPNEAALVRRVAIRQFR